MVINSLSSCLSWKDFISPSFLRDSLAGYSSLSWQSFPFKTWNMSFSFLQDCQVSAEKCAFKLMELSLNMTWHFSLVDFRIFLYLVFSIVSLYCKYTVVKIFLVMSVLSSISFLKNGFPHLFQNWRNCYYNSIE